MENKRGASTHRWSVLSSILRVDRRVAGPGIVVPWQKSNGGHASRVARVIMLPVLENGSGSESYLTRGSFLHEQKSPGVRAILLINRISLTRVNVSCAFDRTSAPFNRAT